MKPDIGMKLSLVLAHGTGYAPGLQAWSSPENPEQALSDARRIVADFASLPFFEQTQAVDTVYKAACEEANRTANDQTAEFFGVMTELGAARNAKYAGELDEEQKAALEAELEEARETVRTGTRAIQATLDEKLEAAAQAHKVAIEPILAEKYAAIKAAWAKIISLGGIYIWWPDELGAFPDEQTIDEWEAAYDAAQAVTAAVPTDAQRLKAIQQKLNLSDADIAALS